MTIGIVGWWILGVDRADTAKNDTFVTIVAPLARPASPPRQLSADLRPAEDPPLRALVVEVVDILGGPVEQSHVSFEGQHLGSTDKLGILNIDFGRYALPRTGLLVVRGDGYAEARKLAAVPGQVRVSLVPEATIAGVVIERRTDKPIGGMRVGSGDRSTVADPEGHFQFRGMPPGAHVFWARGKGYVGETPGPIGVGLGTIRENVRILVDPSLTIDGRVHSAGRLPPLQLHVSVSKLSASPGMGDVAEVDEQGRFTFFHVTPGTYELRAFPSDAVATQQYSPLLVPSVTTVVDAEDVEVEIDIGILHTLLVEVLDERNEPVPGVHVRFTQSNEMDLVGAFRETDAFGRVWIDGLIPGTVKGIQPGIPGIAPVSVMIPTEEVVRFKVPARASMFGRLETEDGAAPRSRMLVLRAVGGDAPAGWTQSDLYGEFRMDGLSAGSYDLEIHANGGELGVVMGVGGTAPEFVVPVTLRGGETTGELVVALPVRKGGLRGRIVDGHGMEVSAAVVTYALDWEQPSPPEAGIGDAVTTTDSEGRFAFTDVEIGPGLVITAWTPEGAYGTRRGVSAGAEPVELVVEVAN